MRAAVPSFTRASIGAALVLLALSFVACSSGDSGGAEDGGTRSSDATASTGGGAASGDGDGALPLGTSWETFAVAAFTGETTVTSISTLGDSAWVTGSRWNMPVVWRSSDGRAWEEIEIAPPGDDDLSVKGIVERGDGGYLAYGARSWQCALEGDAPAGYRFLHYCQRERPVIYLSDDGESWRLVEPAAMAPLGADSIEVTSLAAYSGGFVAVGNAKAADWHGRVWTSADGQDWSLAAEVRGDRHTSLVQVLSNGEDVVLIATEHECAAPRDTRETGWSVGSDGDSQHLIYQGTDPSALRPLAAGSHPFAAETVEVDCDALTYAELQEERYGTFRGLVTGDTITLVERRAPEDTRDDEVRTRQIVRLLDGEWVTDEVELPQVSSVEGVLVDVEGTVGIVGDSVDSSPGLGALWAVISDGRAWEHRDAVRMVTWNQVIDATYLDGALLAVGTARDEPFTAPPMAEWSPSSVLIARSAPVAAGDRTVCVLEAGGQCVAVTFSEMEGAPNFEGRDFSGADFTTADLDGGNFDEASFRDAVMVGVTGTRRTSFVGTDFAGADLRGADLSGLARADLTGARLAGASIRFSDAITLDGVSLNNALIWQRPYSEDDYHPLELSLAGIDLTRARIRGPEPDKAPPLVITDLRGATLHETRFEHVDLSRANVTGVALSGLLLDEHSICPSGAAPIPNGSFGTCE